MLMKLRVLHDMAFPAHWKEAFMMQSFSDWWFPSLPAATGQTPAPVVSLPPLTPVASQRMFTLQRLLRFLLTCSLLVLSDFGDFGTFAPLLPAVRAETTVMNVDPSCMFFGVLA